MTKRFEFSSDIGVIGLFVFMEIRLLKFGNDSEKNYSGALRDLI